MRTRWPVSGSVSVRLKLQLWVARWLPALSVPKTQSTTLTCGLASVAEVREDPRYGVQTPLLVLLSAHRLARAAGPPAGVQERRDPRVTARGRGLAPTGHPAATLWVPVIRFMSCDLRILMDQPAESIPSGNPSSRRDDRWFGGPKRWGLPQGAGRAVAVVMVGVLGQHPPQLSAADDQHPVQQLPPDGAHPPLGVGVRPRRPHRRAQHPDPLGREDRVEC